MTPAFLRLCSSLVFCLALLSCAKLNEPKSVQSSSLVIPHDEATESERLAIDQTLSEIEKIAQSLGHLQSFRSLPIVVTSENPHDTHRFAACFSEGGRGKFIQVNRLILEKERIFFSGASESTLFQVLLHEIGHCYFSRNHSDEQIPLDKHRVSFRNETGRHELPFLSLNASAMHSKNMIAIKRLKKYYIAEIIGLVPLPNIQALRDFSPYTIVEREPEAVLP